MPSARRWQQIIAQCICKSVSTHRGRHRAARPCV